MTWLGATPPPEEVVTAPLRGYPLRISFEPQSYIGRSLYFRGMYEEQIVGKLASLLHPGMTFLDVGANIGLHTIVAAHRVGAAGRVLAVEPQSDPYERLQHNVALNDLSNVTIFHCALGATEGTMQLYKLSARNTGLATLAVTAGERPLGTETVHVRRLSALAAAGGISRIDGVKIDVEGAELEVLRGADEYFSRQRPGFMLIECIDDHLKRFGTDSGQLVAFLQDRGYGVRALIRGRWKPVGRGETVSADLLALHTV